MIKIYTFSDKRPDFIYKQKKLFDKFVEDEFEFIVVNSASTRELSIEIDSVCSDLGIKTLKLPFLNNFAPMPACSKPIQWCWNEIISKDEKNISIIIDSDMFLVKKFNFLNYLGDNHMCADFDKRAHINYIWNGLMIFSPDLPNKNTLNFSENVIDNIQTDVGGSLYYYFKQNSIKIKHIENIGYICSKNNNVKFLPLEIQNLYDDSYLSEFFEQSFFHYRAGSNWNHKSDIYHKNKTLMLDTLIEKALNDSLNIPENTDYKFHELDNWWSVEWPTNVNEYTRFLNGKWT